MKGLEAVDTYNTINKSFIYLWHLRYEAVNSDQNCQQNQGDTLSTCLV